MNKKINKKKLEQFSEQLRKEKCRIHGLTFKFCLARRLEELYPGEYIFTNDDKHVRITNWFIKGTGHIEYEIIGDKSNKRYTCDSKGIEEKDGWTRQRLYIRFKYAVRDFDYQLAALLEHYDRGYHIIRNELQTLDDVNGCWYDRVVIDEWNHFVNDNEGIGILFSCIEGDYASIGYPCKRWQVDFKGYYTECYMAGIDDDDSKFKAEKYGLIMVI